MAKVIFLNNWLKNTTLSFLAFPFGSLFGADVAVDMKYFLMYADKNAVNESAITEECIKVVADETAERIENILACVDYTEDEMSTANGELNVCLVNEDIPNKIYDLLTINNKEEVFCKRIAYRMAIYNEDLTEAVARSIDEITFWIFN